MPKIATILMLRPIDKNDPSLINHNEKYLLPKAMDRLQRSIGVNSLYISLQQGLPEENYSIIEGWGFPVIISNDTASSRRLNKLMVAEKIDIVVVLNSYSYLINTNALNEAIETVRKGHSDFVYAKNVIPSKYFAVLNQKAVTHIDSVDNDSTSPLYFHALSFKGSNIAIKAESGIESKAELFLWKLIFGDQMAMIPPDLIKKKITAANNGVETDSENKLIFHVVSRESFLSINQYLSKKPNLTPQVLGTIASQIAWMNKYQDYIPKKKGGTFLEIGCGVLPVISFYFLDHFDKGVAVDPAASPGLWEDAFELCLLLKKTVPHLLPRFIGDSGVESIDQVWERFDIRKNVLEDLELSSNSFDFIFSKAMLLYVIDIGTLLNEIMRVLKKGCTTLHQTVFFPWKGSYPIVDFNYLKYSKGEYAAAGFRGNNWRINDILSVWESSKSEIEILHRIVAHKSHQNVHVHPSFADYSIDDLFCEYAVIKAIKR